MLCPVMGSLLEEETKRSRWWKERSQLPGRVPTGVQLEEVQGLHATGVLNEDLSSILSNQVFGANYR